MPRREVALKAIWVGLWHQIVHAADNMSATYFKPHWKISNARNTLYQILYRIKYQSFKHIANYQAHTIKNTYRVSNTIRHYRWKWQNLWPAYTSPTWHITIAKGSTCYLGVKKKTGCTQKLWLLEEIHFTLSARKPAIRVSNHFLIIGIIGSKTAAQ